MSFWKWSKTAGENDSADSTVNLREGQSPSTLNDSARAMMTALAKYRDDVAGTIVTGGSSTAYTVSTNQSMTSLTAGFVVAFLPHTTSGASPTLNVDSSGALPLRGLTDQALPTGSLVASTPYVAVLGPDEDEWLLHGYYSSPSTIPIGGLLPYVGSSAPNSLFVLPYGQAVSRTTYATLFALTSTAFGVGDGSTTFNLPDLRGRVPFGQDNMGGSAASRLTTSGTSIDGTTIGASGGAETATIAQANLPNVNFTGTSGSGGAHNHNIVIKYYNTGGDAGALGALVTPTESSDGTINETTDTESAHTHSLSVSSGGSGTALNKMPPAIVLPYIMRVI